MSKVKSAPFIAQAALRCARVRLLFTLLLPLLRRDDFLGDLRLERLMDLLDLPPLLRRLALALLLLLLRQRLVVGSYTNPFSLHVALISAIVRLATDRDFPLFLERLAFFGDFLRGILFIISQEKRIFFVKIDKKNYEEKIFPKNLWQDYNTKIF